MLLARFLFQEASLFWFKNSVFFDPPRQIFRSTPSLLSQGGLHILTKPSLLRREGCNRPPVLRTASLSGWRGIKALAIFCGMGPPGDSLLLTSLRLGTACFWLHCAWGQLASFPRHILRDGTTAWGTLKVKK